MAFYVMSRFLEYWIHLLISTPSSLSPQLQKSFNLHRDLHWLLSRQSITGYSNIMHNITHKISKCACFRHGACNFLHVSSLLPFQMPTLVAYAYGLLMVWCKRLAGARFRNTLFQDNVFLVIQPMLSLRLCQVNDNPIPDFRPLGKATLIEYEPFEMILEFCNTYFIYWSQRHGVREVESYRKDILQHGTVECRYSTVKHNMILHVIRQWLRKNMHPRSCSQHTSLSHPRGWAMECFLWGFGWQLTADNGLSPIRRQAII